MDKIVRFTCKQSGIESFCTKRAEHKVNLKRVCLRYGKAVLVYIG